MNDRNNILRDFRVKNKKISNMFKIKDNEGEKDIIFNDLNKDFENEIEENALFNRNKCVILIPVYKNVFEEINQFEIDSIRNLLLFYDDKYDIFFVCPKKLKRNIYYNLFGYNIKFKSFDNYFFETRYGYSDLCLSTEFYELFNEYEYMLISQTDSWIFKDELLKWCDYGFDYIGAPHFLEEEKRFAVGNGGFSLRRIEKFIEVSKIKNEHRFEHNDLYLEDRFWTNIMKEHLNICPLNKAFNFAITIYSYENLININSEHVINNLPFGAHVQFNFYTPLLNTCFKHMTNKYVMDENTEKSITIGFCSDKKDDKFKKYINNIFGYDVEIINKVCSLKNNTSLSSAYNQILKESKNNIVILMHNDIFFRKINEYPYHIKNIFIELFDNNTEYGIIGLMGGEGVSKENTTWNDGNPHGHYIQGYKFSKKDDIYINSDKDKCYDTVVHEVMTVDGMFMAINKKRIKKMFDETNKSFNFYDIDFCVANYLDGVKIGVTKSILIKHDSEGNYNDIYEYDKKWFIN